MRKELLTSILFFNLLFSKDNKNDIEESITVDKNIIGHIKKENCPYDNVLEIVDQKTGKSIGLIRKKSR